ncbi:MAG: asnB [Pedosphaera sp.]|nr:asnB [Pedosphaera sp.]
MCGIAAIFNYRTGKPVDKGELSTIRDHMMSRGPDGAGEWYSADHRVGLGHRRLAIIDLSPTGAQPMKNPEGTLVVTFNGEIYNYRELRSQLEKRGHCFQSQSDTEILLHLYAEKGEAMVRDLRGMYAFAIWDAQKRGLFLARDPFGIKPLYYADDGTAIRVASQVKTLLAGGHVDTAPEPAGHVGFFLWGNIPEPYTLYRGIRALPAGHSLWIDEAGSKRPTAFCSITKTHAQAEIPNSEARLAAADYLRSSLQDTVRHHLIADVPVGVFLSSGLDSATLVALAAAEQGRLKTVTLGFEEYRGTANDEVPLAELVARQYGTEHQTIWVTRADFHACHDHLFNVMDQPSIDGVNTYFVSLAATRASLKVALSGLGGDELFGGYPSFQEIPKLVNSFRFFTGLPAFGQSMRVLSHPVLKRFTSPKYAGLFEYGGSYAGAYLLRRALFMPWELAEFLDGDLLRAGWQELQPLLRLEETLDGLKAERTKISALESCWYMRNQLLRDSDWASMAHSLELRTPLVDSKLLETLAPMLAGDTPPTKRDMASTPTSPLPASILNRRKTGFTIPVREWMVDPRVELANGGAGVGRGLRGWSRHVYSRFNLGTVVDRRTRSSRGMRPEHPSTTPNSGLRLLVLLTDGFGGFGGIAKFNRDFLTALCAYPGTKQVHAMPRLMPESPGTLPKKLIHLTEGLGGKARYLRAVAGTAWGLRAAAGDSDSGDPDHATTAAPGLILCAHINLLPAAFMAKRLWKAPVVLVIHGVDAWQKTTSPLVNKLVNRVDHFISVSNLTKERFLKWTNLRWEQGLILPNCVELSAFQPGPKSPALLERYQLQGRTVLMTLGRLASEERYKGFDEVMQAIPKLTPQIPNLSYLICGDGLDRPRLEQKAVKLGIKERVIFAGRISDAEKADHYRLADAYVMPSSGEGFGIVLLEAMACGIPVMASKLDGSREALRNGEMGILVDPKNSAEVHSGILETLRRPRGIVPEGMSHFSQGSYSKRCHAIMDEILAQAPENS